MLSARPWNSSPSRMIAACTAPSSECQRSSEVSEGSALRREEVEAVVERVGEAGATVYVTGRSLSAPAEGFENVGGTLEDAAAAVTALAVGAAPALAKKQLVIVVKGLDNPFFEAINQGCQKWNGENPDSEY